ncbi:MAG: transporter substrate-binding domain-containing protein [Pseudomonadota bacterium]
MMETHRLKRISQALCAGSFVWLAFIVCAAAQDATLEPVTAPLNGLTEIGGGSSDNVENDAPVNGPDSEQAVEEGQDSTPENSLVTVPQFLNPNSIAPSVGTTTVRTVRFLTTSDFPPFSFVDPSGRLEGFNIGLARELCFEIKARCTMQALPWDELPAALERGQGDAIIAGLRMTDETLRIYAFSKPYLRLPARLFATGEKATSRPDWYDVEGLTIGVQERTAHAAYVETFFEGIEIKSFENQAALRKAVRDGEVDAGFADGVQTAFWLQSRNAADCCVFVGGPYIDTEFFGPGLTIAVPNAREDMRQVLDNGLRRLMRSGKYAELYLRYFPVSFF